MRNIRYGLFLVLAFAMVALPQASPAQIGIGVGISVHVGPPALPVYAQPICPGPGYLWTPGYWAYGDDGYYWVPGTWVQPPVVGVLWTPGYWGWGGGAFFWHAGYWGPHIGFYGGINYGFGYGGVGFVGGRWNGGVFEYNRSVSNVNVTVIHNTYNETVVNNNTRTSFNGGTGGITTRPTAQEQAAEHENHTPPTSAQTEHEHTASTNKAQYASVNGGHPTVAASPRPGVMSGNGVVGARNAGGANNGAMNATHNDRPPNARNTTPTGNTTPPANKNGNTTTPPTNKNANTATPPRGGNQGNTGGKTPPPPSNNNKGKTNTPPPNKGKNPPPPKGKGEGKDGRGN